MRWNVSQILSRRFEYYYKFENRSTKFLEQ